MFEAFTLRSQTVEEQEENLRTTAGELEETETKFFFKRFSGRAPTLCIIRIRVVRQLWQTNQRHKQQKKTYGSVCRKFFVRLM